MKKISTLALVLTAACLFGSIYAGEKAAPPNDAKQKETLTLVKDLYKELYASTKPQDKSALAQKLLAQVEQSKDDLTAQFVLLKEAAMAAGLAGEPEIAMNALDRIAATFNFDPLPLKHIALKLASSASAKDAEKIKLIVAMTTLLDKPKDPAASAVVAKYECLNGNWESGLPLLLAGNDPGWKKAAQDELKAPAAAADQCALADEWWVLGERETNKTTKITLQLHAKKWYDAALPELTGLQKAKAVTRTLELHGVVEFAPPLSTDATVNAGLEWLATHQETDGHWDAKKYTSEQKTDTAVTGFALWAFSLAGHSENKGKYKDTVQKAVAWLKSKQAANGCIWDKTDAAGHRAEGYCHAIAGVAIMRAAAASKNPDTVKAAQHAIDYTTKIHQAPSGGFRYHSKMEGCMSVSGWYHQQLAVAKATGLIFDPHSIELAIEFLKSLEHADGDASVYWYQVQQAHELSNMTMAGINSRTCLGVPIGNTKASVEKIIAKSGRPKESEINLYYWHYGTLAANLVGGETAKEWNDALKKTLTARQAKDGADAGSWPVEGAYCTEWGRGRADGSVVHRAVECEQKLKLALRKNNHAEYLINSR